MFRNSIRDVIPIENGRLLSPAAFNQILRVLGLLLEVDSKDLGCDTLALIEPDLNG